MEANQQASASFMESQEPTEKEETPEDLGHLGSGGSSCDELFALQPHHGYLEKTVGQNYSLNTF